jgi:hypothetical protein
VAESKRLWVFGASNCLPWRLEDPDQGWMNLLAQNLQADLSSHAKEACDNLYIYHKIIEQAPQISNTDYVIVGWTHPSRKTWVFDPENPEHVKLTNGNDTLVYPGDPTFFRAYNNSQPNFGHWSLFQPVNYGKKFFDTWFNNYYHRHEQDLTMQSHLDSARQRLPKNTVFFYFSEESLSGIAPKPNGVRYLEFVTQNQVNIDHKDMHANAVGHKMLFEMFYKSLTQT